MPHRPRKALIIGAGIAGPVAAILLRRAGIESAIYEAWPYSKGIGGGLQIAPNGMHVMDEIGLAGELINRGSIAESFDFYSQGGKKLPSVRRDLEAAANPFGVGPGFVDRGFDAGAAQQDRGNGPGDAGADDQGLAGTMGHDLLLTFPWC